MNIKNKTPLNILFSIALILFLSLGCSEIEKFVPESGSNKKNHYKQKIEELYEKVKKSGEKVPEDTVEWAKEEIRKIGTWEYKVVILKFDNDSALEAELNNLGKERWECFWVKETDTGLRFYFKREVRSHLRSIPLGEILRTIS